MLDAYRKVLAVLGVAIFFTNFSGFTEQFGLIPLIWIALYAGLCGPLMLHGLMTQAIPIRPVVWWGALYLVISILWFYRTNQDAFAYQQVQTRVLSVIFLLLSLVVYSGKDAVRAGRIAIVWAVVLATALNVYELFNPMTFSDIPGRSSGLYYNVNQSSAALVLGLILGYHVLSPSLRLPFIVVTALGIIPTFSRAGILAWLLVIAFFVLRAGFGVAQIRRVLALTTVVIALLISPVLGDIERTLEERGALTLNVLDRLAFFGGQGAQDASTSERASVALKAWEIYGESPLLGMGTGENMRIEGFEVGTHNIYLAMLVDHGVIGFFVVPLLLLTTLWGLNRATFDVAVPFAVFILLWGFFSHNVLEERYILLAFGLVASLVAAERRPRPAEPAPLPTLPSRYAPPA
jgi:cytochrome c oxidase subunit IV